MIVAVMLGLGAVAQAASPAPGDDIVVIGERLKHLRIVMKKDRKTGVTACTVEPPSGDRVFDAGVCDTYRACVAKVRTASALDACMRSPLTALAERWGKTRQGQ